MLSMGESFVLDSPLERGAYQQNQPRPPANTLTLGLWEDHVLVVGPFYWDTHPWLSLLGSLDFA
jgi:hypothetical protein